MIATTCGFKKRPRGTINPHMVCPKCGKFKSYNSNRCIECRRKDENIGNPTRRMKQVIIALAEGKSLKEIGAEWNRTERASWWAWMQCKVRFGFRSYVDAARYAYRQGWVKP